MPFLYKSPPDKLKFITSLCLLCFLLVGLYLRWKCLDEVFVNEWIARDFDRAFNIFDGVYFPLAGPELNNGGRLPGPFMYLFLCIPLFFHYSYESIFVFNFILNIGAIGLLFWVLFRFFGFYMSALCTVFFSLNLSHIGVVTFPFNPAYIFPFTILFLWFLLELTVTRKGVYLAGLGVIICLGIQFHYTVVTYSFVVVFIVALFKIPIRLKAMVVALILISICLLPYEIHKLRSHTPNNAGESLTFKENEPFSLGKVIKIASIQNTISRITEEKSFFYGTDHSDIFKKINWFVLSFCFYYMVIMTVVGAKKGGIKSCQKEIAVLAMFYIPGLMYEISRPQYGHFWYVYIFIIPQILILSMTAIAIFQWFRQISVKAVFAGIFSFYLLYFSYHSVVFVQEFLSAQPKNFKQHTYKKSKVLLRSLMERLNLTPHEFYERVYLRDYNPNSLKRIQLAALGINEDLNKNNHESQKNCFFVIDPLEKNILSMEKLNTFLEDKDLEVQKKHVIQVDTGSASREILAYEYTTRFSQACYRNLSNTFLTEKSLRDLFIDAKKLIKKPRLGGTAHHPVLKVETLSLKENYDSNLRLKTFDGHYVFFNSHTQLPFRLKIKIENKDGRYFLRGDIENYYFWEGPNYKMQLFIVKLKNKKDPKQEFVSTILNPNKLINKFGSSNINWFREVELANKIDWTNDQFELSVGWQTSWYDPNSSCCGSDELNYYILKNFL